MTSSSRGAPARIGVFVATCAYVGFAPVAPGTFGSAVGLLLYAALRQAASPALDIAVILVLFIAGVWSAGITERELRRTDPGPVVLDEVVGMLITLALLPVNLAGAIVGFIVFRILDVVKPWPSARFEALHGGLGIMADDAMAAIYGNLIMRLLLALAPLGWLA